MIGEWSKGVWKKNELWASLCSRETEETID